MLGCTQTPAPSGPTATPVQAAAQICDSARHFPASPYLWLGCNLEDRLDAKGFEKAFDEVVQADPRLAEVARDIEKKRSFKLRELLKTYACSFNLGLYPGHGATFPGGGPKATDLLVELRLNEPEQGVQGLRQFFEPKQSTTVAGHPAWLDESNFCYCRAGNSFWIASDKSSLEKALAISAPASLGEQNEFKQALGHLSQAPGGTGAFIYLEMGPCWKDLALSTIGSQLDAEGVRGVSSLAGLVASLTPDSNHWNLEVFASVTGEHEFAKALRSPHQDSRALFQHVPRSWGVALTFDLGAWYSIALADLRLFPESRNLLPRFLKQSGLGPDGAREKLVRRALTGQATLCFDLKEWAGQTSALEVDVAEPPLVLILGVKDGPALDQLLNQLGPTEKRGADRYSKSRNFGWTRLSNPEAVAFSLNSGEAALSDLHSLRQAQKRGVLGRDCLSEYAEASAEFGWMDFQPVEDALNGQSGNQFKLVRSQFPNYAGNASACLQVEPEGWRLRARHLGQPLASALSLGISELLGLAANNSGSEQFKSCQQNCKNLSTGLEMYASDHQGHYPGNLSELVTGQFKYLGKIPQCPAAAEDTYSASYRMNREPDRFSLCCSGHHHGNLAPAQFPSYSSEKGLRFSP